MIKRIKIGKKIIISLFLSLLLGLSLTLTSCNFNSSKGSGCGNSAGVCKANTTLNINQ